MKAYLHSVRLAPKKANIIAKMVRGMSVEDALILLENTHKKGARILEGVIASAKANAIHNQKQVASQLMVKTVVVNQGAAYRRGVPKARGQMRPIKKFMSHISVTLGLMTDEPEKKPTKEKKTASKKADAPVQTASKKTTADKKSASKSSSSAS